MKARIGLVLGVLFLLSLTVGVVQAARYPGVDPAVAKQLDAIGPIKVKKFIFDSAVGSNGSSTVDSGVHGLGVYLPAGAVIVRSYLYVNTQLVDDGSGTLAFHCEDANNIKTATDMTGTASAGWIEGASTGATSAFVGSIAASCEIKATVATASISAGKMTGFVHYLIP